MERFLFWIDRISMWAGKVFGWAIVLLTVMVSYDVIFRKFNQPFPWAYDGAYILYGTIFMMGGAYTLSRSAHVRGDIFYQGWSVRVQAAVDLALYLLFFIPGIIALIYAGSVFAADSWRFQERSTTTSGGPPVYEFKTVIPVAAALMLLQGLAEIIRAVQALRTGQWPRRLSDVEETETRLAREETV